MRTAAGRRARLAAEWQWIRDHESAICLTLVLVAVGAFAALFGVLGVRNQRGFGTWSYDMGIYDQAIWLVSRGGSTFMTVRGLDVWGHHFNPILYLFVPFYWLGAGPSFLYVVQNTLLGLGALPVYLIATARFRRPVVGLLFAADLPGVHAGPVHRLGELPPRSAGDHAVPVRLVLRHDEALALVLRVRRAGADHPRGRRPGGGDDGDRPRDQQPSQPDACATTCGWPGRSPPSAPSGT